MKDYFWFYSGVKANGEWMNRKTQLGILVKNGVLRKTHFANLALFQSLLKSGTRIPFYATIKYDLDVSTLDIAPSSMYTLYYILSSHGRPPFCDISSHSPIPQGPTIKASVRCSPNGLIYFSWISTP